MILRVLKILLIQLFLHAMQSCVLSPSSLGDKIDEHELKEIAYNKNITYTYPGESIEALRYTSENGDSLVIIGTTYWIGKVISVGDSRICYKYSAPTINSKCDFYVKNGNTTFVISENYGDYRDLNDAYIHLLIDNADKSKVLLKLKTNLREKEEHAKKEREKLNKANREKTAKYLKLILGIGEGITYAANAVVGFGRNGITGMAEQVALIDKDITHLNRGLGVDDDKYVQSGKNIGVGISVVFGLAGVGAGARASSDAETPLSNDPTNRTSEKQTSTGKKVNGSKTASSAEILRWRGICAVTAKWPGGGVAKNLLVKAVAGDLFGGMTKEYLTDQNGVAIVKWRSKGKMTKIFANGKAYNVNCKSGESITVVLN